MQTDKATPRPWRAHGCVIEAASRCVTVTRGGIARADWQDDCPDARLIVRAVNAHDALVSALDELLKRASTCHCWDHKDNPTELCKAVDSARAALRAAKGEA